VALGDAEWQVELVDVLPTLLDLWGVPAERRPSKLDGRSLLPLVKPTSDAAPSQAAPPPAHAARRYVRSAMRHPMRLPSADGGAHGEWVCGEQHYVRTERAALTSYLYAGRVLNTSLFDLHADPYEQTNLAQTDPRSWEYPMVQAWATLVATERELWPRDGVRARDEAARRAGEQCGEYGAAAGARRRARLLRQRRGRGHRRSRRLRHAMPESTKGRVDH
jgi:arylsulfatase A-like enzyme